MISSEWLENKDIFAYLANIYIEKWSSGCNISKTKYYIFGVLLLILVSYSIPVASELNGSLNLFFIILQRKKQLIRSNTTSINIMEGKSKMVRKEYR